MFAWFRASSAGDIGDRGLPSAAQKVAHLVPGGFHGTSIVSREGRYIKRKETKNAEMQLNRNR